MEKLPESITKLHNLQVLNLRRCSHLKELPENLSKLVNLRLLDLHYCSQLTHMPTGMNNLTCLRELTMFVVDKERIGSGKIKDMKALVNLRGGLTVRVRKSSPLDALSKATQAGNDVLRRARLERIKIHGNDIIAYREEDLREALLDELQPNPDYLRELEIMGYIGVRLPSWACWRSSMATSLPFLVRMELKYLSRLQHLPALSRLRHLKHLYLDFLPCVEYMEERDSDSDGDGDAPLTTTFFPSLEELHLNDIPKLKGWWREVGTRLSGSREEALLSLSGLGHLEIYNCPNMKSFLACPNLKQLKLSRVNERLRFGEKGGVHVHVHVQLQCLHVDDLRSLTLYWESIDGIVHLSFKRCMQKCFSNGSMEGFRRCASSLRHLEIHWCDELESLRGIGLEHLTNLETLSIKHCRNLAMDDEDEEKGLPWKSLQALSSLCLEDLPKMENLPKGFQYLTALQSLQIEFCAHLTVLPEWLSCLTSLRSLLIRNCSKLESLPKAVHHLPSLTTLRIINCGGLTKRCHP